MNIRKMNKDIEKSLMNDLKFIDELAEYIKNTPNSVWSKHQTNFINSVLRSTNQNRKIRK